MVRASSIPLEHQKQIMDWLRDNKQLFNTTPDYIVYAEYMHYFTDKLTGQPVCPNVTKSKFTRFLHTQGIVRRTARINGRLEKAYGIDAYQLSPNDRLDFRAPTKTICPTCHGDGWVTPDMLSTTVTLTR